MQKEPSQFACSRDMMAGEVAVFVFVFVFEKRELSNRTSDSPANFHLYLHHLVQGGAPVAPVLT